MPSVETIYRESVMPLPVGDQMRLAELIMERTSKAPKNAKRLSALEILESYHAQMLGRTAAEIDASIKAERDSWDD